MKPGLCSLCPTGRQPPCPHPPWTHHGCVPRSREAHARLWRTASQSTCARGPQRSILLRGAGSQRRSTTVRFPFLVDADAGFVTAFFLHHTVVRPPNPFSHAASQLQHQHRSGRESLRFGNPARPDAHVGLVTTVEPCSIQDGQPPAIGPQGIFTSMFGVCGQHNLIQVRRSGIGASGLSS